MSLAGQVHKILPGNPVSFFLFMENLMNIKDGTNQITKVRVLEGLLKKKKKKGGIHQHFGF